MRQIHKDEGNYYAGWVFYHFHQVYYLPTEDLFQPTLNVAVSVLYKCKSKSPCTFFGWVPYMPLKLAVPLKSNLNVDILELKNLLSTFLDNIQK